MADTNAKWWERFFSPQEAQIINDAPSKSIYGRLRDLLANGECSDGQPPRDNEPRYLRQFEEPKR